MQKLVLSLFLCFLAISTIAPVTEATPNIVTEWTQKHLDYIKQTFGFLSPPAVARSLAIASSCVYDAWTVFDAKAVPTMNNGIPKVPAAFATEANINETISYAAYRAIYSIFKDQTDPVANLNDFFSAKGYDQWNSAEDLTTPSGIGNRACRFVLEFRKSDHMNQYGDEYGGPHGMPYSDYTGYFPTNPPQTEVGVTDCSKLASRNKWQPLKVPTRFGTTVTQKWAGAQVPNVIPFALSTSMEFRPRGPPAYGGATESDYIEQYTEVLTVSGQLNDTTKTIAEFWADGPASTLPPGHWHHIALESIENQDLGLADSVKLLFLHANAVFDAAIASWDAKRWWDSVRPVTAIHCLYPNEQVLAWLGEYQGVGFINGSEWRPYQNKFFVTPPFAGYISGHSTFSAASAEVFRLFFGSDTFLGDSFTLREGQSLFEPRITEGNPGYIKNVTDVPNSGPNSVGYSPATDITLSWSTWTQAADEAGYSRILGGIHIQADNVDGLAVGRKVGKKVFEKASRLWQGEEEPGCECPEPEPCVTEQDRISSANSFHYSSLVLVLVAMFALL